MGWRFSAFVAALLALPTVPASAFQPPPAVTLREVASGVNQPTEIAHAGDGSGRLFILEKEGGIRILRGGMLLSAPFLDLTSRIDPVNERGLLGIAFHPQYAANGRFFVNYTMAGDGALRISEFRASPSNPDLADPASERPIVTIPHPASNHNGGKLAFGPDGYLYIAVGDGGGGGDPANNAQNLGVPLGKILRIDVSPASGYAVPPSNPFVSTSGALGEIWAYGLRNPWKFSFDRATGDLYIADVGQSSREEVDFVPAGSPGGRNFGWRVFEGTACYPPGTATCFLPNHTGPVLEYTHDPATGGDSITGGYVYRGSRSASLRGHYVFGDFGSNRIWTGQQDAGTWARFVLVEPPTAIDGLTSFGEDEAGELYVASIRNGRIYAIDGPADGMAQNVALSSAGATASASSIYSPAFAASAAIDGDRAGNNWGAGSGWNDGTVGAYPDALQVRFSGLKTIDRVVLYTLQDNATSPVEPTDAMTFTRYGIVDFTVEGWTGTSWVLLGRVTGNNLVKRTLSFPAVAVDRIYVNVTRALGGYSHVTEVEAWTPAAGAQRNVALASAGADAFASSSYSPAFPPSAVIDGDRAGAHWGNGSGWNDGTAGAWPDWLQVRFGGMKTIDRIVVYTLQDEATNPVEPTEAMTFSQFGVVDFSLEGWTGASWVPLGRVTGNNLVKRTVTFPPVAVDRIFINVTRSLGGYSHITELEAWSPGP